jgi:hypothetical protein
MPRHVAIVFDPIDRFGNDFAGTADQDAVGIFAGRARLFREGDRPCHHRPVMLIEGNFLHLHCLVMINEFSSLLGSPS